MHFYDLYAENTGTYGIYPVRSTDVLIERVEATGVDDAGIYAGQCENVVVRDSVAHGNVLGIELENTLGGEVYGNHLYDNSNGILIVLLCETALITPPIGMNLFVVQGVRRRGTIDDVMIGVLPFVVCLFVAIGLLILFPQVALFLPALLGR